MSIAIEPAELKICNNCNLRQPIHRFRRLRKDSDYRRPQCNTCHAAEEYERKHNPEFRAIPAGHKKCLGCKEVLPLERFRKNSKDTHRAKCKDCECQDRQRERKRSRRRTIQEWMGKLHHDRFCKAPLVALVEEMIRLFGGVEKLAAEMKEYYDDACKEKPGGRYRGMVLRTIVQLNERRNEIRAGERQDQSDEFTSMSTEDLTNHFHALVAGVIVENPKLAVAAATTHPKLVQREFRKHGWKLERVEEED